MMHMEAIAIQKKTETLPPKLLKPAPVRASHSLSWAIFQKKYLTREDGFKYEWLAGRVEQTERTMNQTQLFIHRNLLAAFRRLLFSGNVEGELLAECDLFFLKNHRRPDICWLTNAQIDQLSAEKNREIPAFIIEVISTNDAYRNVAEKMDDYRAAGVKVVWHILPNTKEVYVFSGDNLLQMRICKMADRVSAAPALPNFELMVEDIFRVSQPKR